MIKRSVILLLLMMVDMDFSSMKFDEETDDRNASEVKQEMFRGRE